jgi:hypothetical protein
VIKTQKARIIHHYINGKEMLVKKRNNMFQQNVQIKPFNGAMYKIVQNTAFVDVT